MFSIRMDRRWRSITYGANNYKALNFLRSMRFFRKLFQKRLIESSKDEPDNNKLIGLIEKYIADNENESYKKVVRELETGNAYLLLPSETNVGEGFSSWAPSTPGLKLDIGIWLTDGLKATIAFTSEQALFEWAKKPTKYVSFRSQTVLEICATNDIKRVVIDNKLRTMIVLQRYE